MTKYFILFLICVTILNTGCVSMYTYKGSERQISMRKAITSNNETAIKAIRLGESGAGVGIDVSNLEVLKERPFMQFCSALMDAAIIYASKEGVEYLNKKMDEDTEKDEKITININNKEDTTTITIENGEVTKTEKKGKVE